MRLIDADALIQKRLQVKYFSPEMYVIGQGYVMDAPTITDGQQGCEYCDDNFRFWQAEIGGSLPNVKYCPMCGKRLQREDGD